MRVKIVEQPPQDVRTFEEVDLAEKLTMGEVETIREIFRTPLTGSFNWDYDSANAKIQRLYEVGKAHNWNSTLDVDWDAPCDMNDYPMEPSLGALNGYPEYEALSPEEKVRFAWKGHAQTMSQFLHGEQGALLVASQLVSCAPTADAKLYAASQTFDEARHVEVFNQYLRKRCKMIYPINKNLKLLIDKVLADERWDLKFIGMQLIIEGLALAAFGTQVRTTRDPLLKQVVELVMRDEGRHVAFGVNYLEDWIKVLPQEEIEDRAEFAYQACVIMRDRLFGMDVMAEYGFDLEAAKKHIMDSVVINLFRELLFERLIPNLKRVGLITDRIRPKYDALGALKYEDLAGDVLIDWGHLESPLPTKQNLAAARVAAE
ncbi:MAG: ferritin-like domain-containing protein [Hyphomonadaceae bacterium]|nr:ferritin-like domain-containing protein [Hyphomonadaceae bacterium]